MYRYPIKLTPFEWRIIYIVISITRNFEAQIFTSVQNYRYIFCIVSSMTAKHSDRLVELKAEVAGWHCWVLAALGIGVRRHNASTWMRVSWSRWRILNLHIFVFVNLRKEVDAQARVNPYNQSGRRRKTWTHLTAYFSLTSTVSDNRILRYCLFKFRKH